MWHPRLKRGVTASTVSHGSALGAQGHQAFWDAASLGASRAGDFIIMARNGCYVPRTGHDHEIWLSCLLAAAGLRVTLLDQDQPGRATSRWSLAWLNSNDKAPRPYHELNHAGMKAWAELAPDLDGEAWYRPVGHLELATAETAAELEARVKRLTQWGYPARLVDPAEAAALEPALRVPPDAAAAFFPGEGYLLTEPLIARLVTRAESHGAQVRTGEAGRVTGLEPGAAPRVRTATGSVLEADEVVCCAGRWTSALAAVPLVPWETEGSAAPGLVVRVGPA